VATKAPITKVTIFLTAQQSGQTVHARRSGFITPSILAELAMVWKVTASFAQNHRPEVHPPNQGKTIRFGRSFSRASLELAGKEIQQIHIGASCGRVMVRAGFKFNARTIRGA